MADTGECGRVEGRGCGSLHEPQAPLPCDGDDTAGEAGDGDVDSGWVRGSGCACGVGEGPGWLPLLLVAFALARRWGWLGLVLISTQAHAQEDPGVDAQHLHPLDGGPFLALREADGGAPWSVAFAWSTSYARRPVVYVDGGGPRALLAAVRTEEAALSVRFSDVGRLGIAVPWHRVPGMAADQDDVLGDVVVWFQLPLLEAPSPMRLSWTVQVNSTTGAPDLWLGDPRGSVRGLVAASGRVGSLDVLANAGVRLAVTESIPGGSWGKRWEFGVGVGRRIVGPVSATAELFGSSSLVPRVDVPADLPIETIGVVGADVWRGVRVSAGAGGGLTRGLGSPELRLVAMVDGRRRERHDRDGDGVEDLSDRCDLDPEDVDGLQDRDGCPEEDADQDRVLDPADPCPLQAETPNGYQDEDGCPDALTEVALAVESADPALPLEAATVTVGEDAPVQVLSGEPLEVARPKGPTRLVAEADGFHPWSETVDLAPGDRVWRAVKLEPIRHGDVDLRLVDPTGAPLAGFLRRGDALELVPAGGRPLREQAGTVRMLVHAAGHVPREVAVELPAGGRVDVVVQLSPGALRVVGNRIETAQRVFFALDSAELTAEGAEDVEGLAALLQADPRIRLVRIEGHADERGSSLYNLDLSRRRAHAIRDALVARGIDPARVEAIGTGEARPRAEGESASRRVEFLILVWADED